MRADVGGHGRLLAARAEILCSTVHFVGAVLLLVVRAAATEATRVGRMRAVLHLVLVGLAVGAFVDMLLGGALQVACLARLRRLLGQEAGTPSNPHESAATSTTYKQEDGTQERGQGGLDSTDPRRPTPDQAPTGPGGAFGLGLGHGIANTTFFLGSAPASLVLALEAGLPPCYEAALQNIFVAAAIAARQDTRHYE